MAYIPVDNFGNPVFNCASIDEAHNRGLRTIYVPDPTPPSTTWHAPTPPPISALLPSITPGPAHYITFPEDTASYKTFMLVMLGVVVSLVAAFFFANPVADALTDWGDAAITTANEALGTSSRAWSGFNSRSFEAHSTLAHGIDTYPASEVTKFSWYHNSPRRAIHLDGRDIIVRGDVDHAFIRANGNITFTGKVTNTTVVNENYTIHAPQAANSAFTGRHVLIARGAGNKETLTAGNKMADLFQR